MSVLNFLFLFDVKISIQHILHWSTFLLFLLFRSKSDLLYYAEYLPTISTQLKIISSVKAATPSDISVSLNDWFYFSEAPYGKLKTVTCKLWWQAWQTVHCVTAYACHSNTVSQFPFGSKELMLSNLFLCCLLQADAMLIKNAQNLMQAVVKTLKAAEAACVKVTWYFYEIALFPWRESGKSKLFPATFYRVFVLPSKMPRLITQKPLISPFSGKRNFEGNVQSRLWPRHVISWACADERKTAPPLLWWILYTCNTKSCFSL